MTSVRVLAVLSAIYFVAVVIQLFLAGYGVFFGGDLFSSHNTHLEPHRMLGNTLGLVALLVLVAAAFTRRRNFVVVAVVLFLMTGVTGAFASAGQNTPALGGVHVLLAAAIVGASGWLAHKSAQVMREGGAPTPAQPA